MDDRQAGWSRHVDRVVTDYVRQEFQSKGKYQVRPDDSGVDGLLTGTISSVTLQPTRFTDDRRPSAYAIIVVAAVEFKAKRGSALRRHPPPFAAAAIVLWLWGIH